MIIFKKILKTLLTYLLFIILPLSLIIIVGLTLRGLTNDLRLKFLVYLIVSIVVLFWTYKILDKKYPDIKELDPEKLNKWKPKKWWQL